MTPQDRALLIALAEGVSVLLSQADGTKAGEAGLKLADALDDLAAQITAA